MNAEFSRPWNPGAFCRFVGPSVAGIVTICLYMIVDGIFIARYGGPLAMAAANIIMPLFNFSFSLGIMTAAGGFAIVGIEQGRGLQEQANGHFTLILVFLGGFTCLFWGIVAVAGLGPLCEALGATPALLPLCEIYLKYFIWGLGLVLFQVAFEYAVRLDGRPAWAFYSSVAGGLTNMGLDYLLMARLDMGIAGAGIASSAGVVVAACVGGFYFLFHARHLRPGPLLLDVKFLFRTVVNGSSEMITELSGGVKTLVFNMVILKYAGEPGVAAMAMVLYLFYAFSAVHMGLSMGVSPVISYNLGRGNFTKIRELASYSLVAGGLTCLVSFGMARFFSRPILTIFTGGHGPVMALGLAGLGIFSFTFLCNWINILASGFFTAVNNGKISALISILDTFVLTLGFVWFLPPLMGMTGIWLAVPLAEAVAAVVSLICLYAFRRRYLWPASSTVN